MLIYVMLMFKLDIERPQVIIFLSILPVEKQKIIELLQAV